jgi:hypothetical protein
MHKQITTYNQLLLEKEELEQVLARQKIVLREDFSDLKQQLQPAGNLLNKMGKLVSNQGSLPLLDLGIGLGSNLIMGSKMFRKAGPILKFGIPLAISAITQKGLFQKVGRLFKKKSDATVN